MSALDIAMPAAQLARAPEPDASARGSFISLSLSLAEHALNSNGFATLFLVFHPTYANSFVFTPMEDETVGGRRLTKIGFRHIPGTKTPAALALRGKEYPLELSGVAWVDAETAVLTKMTAGVENTMEDVGLKTLRSEVEFAPVPFSDLKRTRSV